MTTSIQTIEMLAHWEAQPASEQKTVVLAYWKKQAKKLTAVSRKISGDWVPVDATEKKSMLRGLAKQYSQAIKKSGECVDAQVYRLRLAAGIA